MSSDDFIAAITRITAGTMVEGLGIRLTAIGEGSAIGELEYREDLRQPTGLFHVGAILGLADSVATCAAMSLVFPSGELDLARFPLAIQTNANLVGNAAGGRLIATAETVHSGRTTMVVETKVRHDGAKLVATISTTLLVPAR